MKRILALLLSLLFVFLSALSAYAYQITSYSVYAHSRVVSDGDCAYLLSYSDTSLSADRIVPEGGGMQLSLFYAVTTACVFNGTLVALCNDRKADQLVVYTYGIADDILDSFVISHVYVNTDSDFYYDGNLYIVDHADTASILRYSAGGRLTGSYSFGDNVAGMIGRRGSLYAVSNNTLYRISGDRAVSIDGSRVSSPLSFVDDDTLCDAYGRVYESDGDHIRLLLTLDSSGLCCTACSVGGDLYYPFENIVYRYDKNGRKTAYLELDREVVGLYAYNSGIYAVDSAMRVERISPSEFISLTEVIDTDNHISSQADDRRSRQISSSVYSVDYDTMRITGIPTLTTFAAFKKNMRYDDYSVKLIYNDQERKNGNVGTAMRAVFEDDDNSFNFELSVVGDITGEGNVNSRDLTELMDYLIGSLDFDGVYAVSADLSDDGLVDALDLALMKRMVS